MKPPYRPLAAAMIVFALAASPAMSAQRPGSTPAKPAPAATEPAKPVSRAAQPTATPVSPAPAPAPTAPAQPAAEPAQQPQAAQTAAKPGEPAPFTYNPEGRRDPFVSLIGKGSDPRTAGARPPGVPGLLINEVSVKGIVRNSSGFVALIQGSDNKTYVVKAGDRLLDGTVKSIVQDAVVFSQDVNDPLSLVKQKEIRKPLRSAEGGRG
jgi:Tfp pilus assembly protein PilP